MKRSILILLSYLLVTGCELLPDPVLRVKPSSLDFVFSSASKELSILCDQKWEISSDAVWCTVSPSKGRSGHEFQTVQVHCTDNTTDDTRNCRLTVSCRGDKQMVVDVIQWPKGKIELTEKVFSVPWRETILAVDYRSNMDFEIESGPEWIEVISTKAMQDGKLRLRVRTNEQPEREGTVTIVCPPESVMLKIRQASGIVEGIHPLLLQWLVENHLFDANKDGFISYVEAEFVSSIYSYYQNTFIPSLKGIEAFPNIKDMIIPFREKTGTGYTELNVSPFQKLNALDCSGNSLTSLDLSNNPLLDYLHCEENKLTELDISHNPLLKILECQNNRIASLDVSHCSGLTYLDCRYNQITTLNITGLTDLEQLSCGHCGLSELSLPHQPNLVTLRCERNQLTTLDISSCSQTMNQLWCEGNPLKTLYMAEGQVVNQMRIPPDTQIIRK